MWRMIGAAAGAAFLALGGASMAADQARGPQLAAVLTESEEVYAPRGFRELCGARPEFCIEERVSDDVSVVLKDMARLYGAGAVQPEAPKLTYERLEMLQRVNRAVNGSIFPTEDAAGDQWSFNAVAGDCEEYVLMKKEVLARLGWPRSAMRIAVVRGVQYPYHAVLLVSTQGGDFVLDNLSEEISRLEASRYEFVVSQSQARPGRWVRVSR